MCSKNYCRTTTTTSVPCFSFSNVPATMPMPFVCNPNNDCSLFVVTPMPQCQCHLFAIPTTIVPCLSQRPCHNANAIAIYLQTQSQRQSQSQSCLTLQYKPGMTVRKTHWPHWKFCALEWPVGLCPLWKCEGWKTLSRRRLNFLLANRRVHEWRSPVVESIGQSQSKVSNSQRQGPINGDAWGADSQ